MARVQIPLLGGMIAVALVAVALSAIRADTNRPAEFFALGVKAIVLAAVVSARYGRRDRRPFWFGFALFGAVAYYHASINSRGYLVSKQQGMDWSPDPLTEMVISLVPHFRPGIAKLGEIDAQTENAVRIIYDLLALALAVAGGAFAVLVRNRSRRPAGAAAKPVRLRTLATWAALLLGLLGLLALPSLLHTRRPSVDYFPTGLFKEFAGEPDFLRTWFSKHLRAMAEPSLSDLARRDPQAVVYRFLELPSFTHPIGIRITKARDGATLRVVILDGQGGYEPGGVAVDRVVHLTLDQWQELERRIEEANFWNLDTEPPKEAGGVADGSMFVLEGVRGGQYHVIHRPDEFESHPLRAYVHGLTGLDLSDGPGPDRVPSVGSSGSGFR
jgi:hypothetical protein